MASGFDLGVKGVKGVAKGVTKKRHSKRRGSKGGRRTKNNRRR